jgi:uncharacterized DUF497 family protein
MTELEWDSDKHLTNTLKHGIDFEALAWFGWDSAFIERDERFDYGEVRYRAFGRMDGRAVCVAFTPRGTALRIISARYMHEREAKRYGI